MTRRWLSHVITLWLLLFLVVLSQQGESQVVQVTVSRCRGFTCDRDSGTGTVIGQRAGRSLVLTCAHVVCGGGEVRAANRRAVVLACSRDPEVDLALLEVSDDLGRCCELAATDAAIGDKVSIWGVGSGDDFQGFHGQIEEGGVTTTNRQGDSGGPVLRGGYLVGLMWGHEYAPPRRTRFTPLRDINRFLSGLVDPRCICRQKPAPQIAAPAPQIQPPANQGAIPDVLRQELDRIKPDLRNELQVILKQQIAVERSDTAGRLSELSARLDSLPAETQREALAAVAPQLKSLAGELEGKASAGELAKIAARLGPLAGDVASALGYAQVGAIGGPAGAGAALLIGLLISRGRRKAAERGNEPTTGPRGQPNLRIYQPPDDSEPSPRIVPVPVDSPPPPQAVVHSTTFTPVLTDTTSEALAWAKDQLVRKHPGSANSLDLLQSLIDQYLAAKAPTSR